MSTATGWRWVLTPLTADELTSKAAAFSAQAAEVAVPPGEQGGAGACERASFAGLDA